MSGSYLVNQRVIVGNEIGTVQLGPTVKNGPPKVDHKLMKGYVWIHIPSKGYSSCYSEDNVKELPNGQL